MAVIVPYSGGGPEERNVTETTLTASDTLQYNPGTGQILRLRNVTAGALTVNLLGDQAVSQKVEGGGTINYAAGKSIGPIAATTGDVEIPLDSIKHYLRSSNGVIAVTGGTGIKASLRNP
jgi:hypothetical protein